MLLGSASMRDRSSSILTPIVHASSSDRADALGRRSLIPWRLVVRVYQKPQSWESRDATYALLMVSSLSSSVNSWAKSRIRQSLKSLSLKRTICSFSSRRSVGLKVRGSNSSRPRKSRR